MRRRTNEPVTYDLLDRLVDDDPIGLRDVAWAEIERLRAEITDMNRDAPAPEATR